MRRTLRRPIAISSVSLLMAALIGLTAGPTAAATFSNTGAITIPLIGQASPYPSSISVSGMAGTVADVNVTLAGFLHEQPANVDVLLVGPGGRTVTLMNGAGGTIMMSSAVDLTFDDEASTMIQTPPGSQLAGGTYKPTINGTGFGGTPPAPPGPYGTALSVFDGASPDGTWQLFVYDTYQYTMADLGSISGGWSIDITTQLAVTSFTPKAGKVGSTITIEGSAFTGATGVSFGGTPARTFTAGSDTEITAVVPAGAGAGPITVTTPAGTASSAEDFVVQHRRHASLTLNGDRGRGRVDVVDGFTSCAAAVPVKVQHFANHRWHNAASTHTNQGGAFEASGLSDSGKYRVIAKAATLGSGDVCLKATSPVAKS